MTLFVLLYVYVCGCCSYSEQNSIDLIPVLLSCCCTRCVDGYSNKILGYANGIRTMDGGTYIDGVKASITRTLNSLVEKSKLVEV